MTDARMKQVKFYVSEQERQAIKRHVPMGYQSQILRALIAAYVLEMGGEWPALDEETQITDLRHRLFNTENG